MIISTYGKLWLPVCRNSTSFLTFFLRFHKDIANSDEHSKHVWQTPQIRLSTLGSLRIKSQAYQNWKYQLVRKFQLSRKFQSFKKNPTSSLLSFLRYDHGIENLSFRVLWVSLTMATKIKLSTCRKLWRLSSCKKSNLLLSSF